MLPEKKYNQENYTFTFSNENKNEIINFMLDLSVTMDEVLELPPTKTYPRYAKYMLRGDELDLYLPYNPAVGALLRKCAAKFNRAGKIWTVSSSVADTIFGELNQLGFITKEVEAFPEVPPQTMEVFIF